MKTIKPKSVKDHLIVDVRTKPEYEEERIEGSIHIPLHQVENFKEQLSEKKKVVFLCRTGKRAAKACSSVKKSRVLKGGIRNWKHSGGKVVHGSDMWSMDRQVRMGAGTLALAGVVLSILVSPYWLILPGFIGAGLTYSGVTDTCGMAKLLARMPWNSRSSADIEKELK